VTWRGDHFAVDSARLWDLPEAQVRIAIAMSGERSADRFAPLADDLIAVEPKADLIEEWNAADGSTPIGEGARAIGQVPICWDPDEKAAVERAHAQFRWFGGGWNVNADLPTTAGFASASQFVTPDDVAASPPTTSPRRSRADRTSTRSWSRSERFGRPDSPTSRWSRSATKARTGSSKKRRDPCSGSCAQPPRDARPGQRPADWNVPRTGRHAPRGTGLP